MGRFMNFLVTVQLLSPVNIYSFKQNFNDLEPSSHLADVLANYFSAANLNESGNSPW